jgi:putative heme-binding domain-containing protein
MPHIGSDYPDEAGLRLVERWIASLDPAKTRAPALKGPPEKLLADPRSALSVARKLARGELNTETRVSVLAAAARLPAGPVRDLFEGYLPSDGKGRKLGSNPRPRTILALKGDARRGESLFWSSALSCGNCHQIGKRGTAVGPDLSAIGKLRSREDLLESILEPSRRIEPKYAAYLAQLADGRSFTGLLVKRSEKVVVLRDAQNKEIVLATKNVEELRPSRVSLMPQGQLAGLTAQQAADLLEYVASRR